MSTATTNHLPVAGVGLPSAKTTTIARNLGYPSRSPGQVPWAPTTKPLRASKPADLRTTVTFAYSRDNSLPTEDVLDVDGHSFASEDSEKRHGFVLRLLIVFWQKTKALGHKILLATHPFTTCLSATGN